MQTAGVVLDVYDDVSGHVLSSILTREKVAGRPLTVADRGEIKKKNFALPAQRKYPIHDRSHARAALAMAAKNGNPQEQARVQAAVYRRYPGIGAKTASVELPPLLKAASLLPLERYAQVPDRNFALILHNGGEPLRKYAMHDSAHLTLSTLYFLECGHLLPKEAQAVAANNLVQAHSWYDSKPPAALQKVADLIGTEVMPRGTLRGKSIRVNPSKHVSTASKVASASFTDPNVDVQRLMPPAREVAYEPTHTCLQGQYPIDSYEQIKTAEEYFDEYAHEFSPLDRREFAVSLTKRAEDLGIPISGRALDYSGSNFGPHILAEIEKRAANFSGDPQGDVYTTLKKKVASGQVSPDMTAAALYPPTPPSRPDHVPRIPYWVPVALRHRQSTHPTPLSPPGPPASSAPHTRHRTVGAPSLVASPPISVPFTHNATAVRFPVVAIVRRALIPSRIASLVSSFAYTPVSAPANPGRNRWLSPFPVKPNR